MRILFICNEYPPGVYGGIGVFVRNLAEELVKNGESVYVIGVYHEIKNDVEEIINGVNVYRIKYTNTFFGRLNNSINLVFNKFRLSNKLSNLEKTIGFDLIESHDWDGPLYYKPKSKLIIRLHGSNTAYNVFENKKPSKYLKYFERKNLKFADYIVSVSKHMLDITLNVFGNLDAEKDVIYNSYNSEIFKINNSFLRNTYQILFVGKYHERKGVIELFKIINLLFTKNDKYNLVFIGKHNKLQKDFLLNLIDEKIKKRIQFIKAIEQKELVKYYNQSNVMIMPSKAEAFGLTAIEAMSCGCIVAMNNIPITHELIENNKNGLIIDINKVDETVHEINNLINDELRIELMRGNSINNAKKLFSSELIFEMNYSFYKKIFLKKNI
jgi:glycosyltransferase involved in cell wall biosynthesis